MENYAFDSMLYSHQPTPQYNDPMVPDIGPYTPINPLEDDAGLYNPHVSHPSHLYKSGPMHQPGMPNHMQHPTCSSAVKTEQNTATHPMYTNSPHTPGPQFQFNEFFGGGNQPFMNGQIGQPVSPYGNQSISEGTVSSTVSSPRSPRGISHLDHRDEESHVNRKVTDDKLMSMSARDLNKHFKELSAGAISQLKKKRRTLKNRGYALNSRTKRIQQKLELEDEKDILQEQVKGLNSEVDRLRKELDTYKRKVVSLEGILSTKVSSR